MDYIRQIEDVNNRRMKALRPPHRKEVLKAREDDIKDRVQNWMSRENEPRLQRISSELLKEYDSTELVASLLQELVEANDEVEVQLTFEKPLARKIAVIKAVLEEVIINVVMVSLIIKIDDQKGLKVNQAKRKTKRNLTVEISNKKW